MNTILPEVPGATTPIPNAERGTTAFSYCNPAGLSFRLLDDIFPRIRPEDLPSFVQKLQSLLLTLAARRDLRNPSAYIHKALESWLDSL